MHRLRIAPVAALVALTLLGTGCVGFSGPNDIRHQITKSQPVELEKEQGFSVGPVGFFLVGTLAAPWLPMDVDGMSSVDFGEYRVVPLTDDPACRSCLRALDLPGWETVVRVREPGSDMLVMVNERGEKVTGLLFLQQEGHELVIVRARGNFEKVLDNLLESDLIGDFDFDLDFGSHHATLTANAFANLPDAHPPEPF